MSFACPIKSSQDWLNLVAQFGPEEAYVKYVENNFEIPTTIPSINSDDRIIFGHPTIGKSYLKKKGDGRFITLDDDYADEVNSFIDANRGKETRQEYKGRKPQEYNQFMLSLFDRLKQKAAAENKILFVSNTNILKERMSDFDKVITIPKDEFKRRFDERGSTYGFEDWKQDIDNTISKVPSGKVIITDKYLSDLMTNLDFARPMSYDGQLEQFKNRYHLVPVVKDGIRGYKADFKIVAAMRKQLAKSGWLYDKLRIRYNNTSKLLEIEPDPATNNVLFNREEQDAAVAREIFDQVMGPIATSLGVEAPEIVTLDEARLITAGANHQYNGESAFNIGGKAYVLDTAITLENGIHEVSHPLVSAIAQSNPILFKKLHADFIATATGATIAQEVARVYADFSADKQAEEVVVRGLTALAQNKIKEGEQPRVRSLMQRLLYAIKQLLRSVFGKSVKVENLNENTSLSQLAEMLVSDEHRFELNTVTEKDIIEFNRDNKALIDDLSKLETAQLNRVVNNYYAAVNEHTRSIMSNPKYEDIKNTTTDATDRNQFLKMKDMLKRATDEGNNTVEVEKKVRQLAHTITETEFFTAKILERIKEINNLNDPNSLNTLVYYSNVMGTWREFTKRLIKQMNDNDVPANSELFRILGSISTNIDTAFTNINKNNESAVIKMLNETLGGVRDEIKADHLAKVAVLEEAVRNGVQGAQNRLDDEIKKFQRFDLSEENLLRFIRGEMGDTNAFSGFLEAYISSPDPIIGGYAKLLNTHMYAVQARVRKIDQDMRRELDPHYKAAGVDRGDPAALGKQLSMLDKTLDFENGNPIEGQTITLMNQFKDYRYDVDLLNYKITRAKAENNEDELIQLRRELKQLEADYFHREFVDEYYQLQDIWKTDIGGKAREKRQEILNDIADIQDTLSNDPDTRVAQLAEINDKWKEYSQLASLYNLAGELKTGEAKDIAEVIREYNEKSKPFYEWKEIKGLFNFRYNEAKQTLLDDGIKEGSAEFAQRMQDWVTNNTRVSLNQKFYEDRKVIIDRIAKILSVLPDADRKEMEIGPLWEKIIDLTKGYRDEDGQPVGSDIDPVRMEKIKTLQEEIIEAQKNYAKLSGLSENDSELLSQLFALKQKGPLTADQRDTLAQLLATKSELKEKLGNFQSAELFKLFDDLKALQSKQPTDYYLETVNQFLSDANSTLVLTTANADDFLSVPNLDTMLNANPKFKDWFQRNHVIKDKWNQFSNMMEPTWERIYVWNRIVPNDPKYYERYQLQDGSYIAGVPNKEYFRRQVKSEFKTGYDAATGKVKRVVGLHVDNKGNWLPKTVAQGAKDSKYINKEYEKLKASNSPVFKILEVMTKYHLKAQEDSYGSNKLWMDIPRFRKTAVENFQLSKLKGDVSTAASKIGAAASALVTKKEDDFSSGQGNFKRELEERLVYTDLFNNELIKIPIKGLSRIDVNETSLDIGRSIMKYTMSMETNKELMSIQPVTNALMNILEVNGVNDISAIKKQTYLSTGEKVFIPSKKNNRLRILKQLVERTFEGKEHHHELGEVGNKLADQMMHMASWGTLAFDVPGSLKNVFAANVQGFIETLNGRYITREDFRKGTSDMVSKYIPAMIADFNKFSNQSLETQMFQMFDVIQGRFEDNVGNEFGASVKSGVASMNWAFSLREFGEIEAQGAFWLGMMRKQKVDQTINGVTTQIMYKDAFEKKDGVVALKEGIDPAWGEGGAKFNDFKLKAHELSQKLQGNYAKINQPEMQRYTMGRMVNFMRRYFVSAGVNRFSTERVQVGLGNTREGYYITSVRVMRNWVRDQKLNWALYSDEEKGNVIKTLGEIATSLTFYLLLRMLGWNPDDKDRIKKLKENSWATNHLIYQLMAVKSESEQFIPIPTMGMDEMVRIKNTPSLVFGHFDKYYKLMGDVIDLANYGLGRTDEEKIRFQQDPGFWDKGDLKIEAHAARIFGFTGGTIDSRALIKNYDRVQGRTK